MGTSSDVPDAGVGIHKSCFRVHLSVCLPKNPHKNSSYTRYSQRR